MVTRVVNLDTDRSGMTYEQSVKTIDESIQWWLGQDRGVPYEEHIALLQRQKKHIENKIKLRGYND